MIAAIHLFLIFSGITLNEALNLLEDEKGTCDLFIEPPDVAELTDEDFGDKEEFFAANLTGNQFCAAAEIKYHKQIDKPAVDKTGNLE